MIEKILERLEERVESLTESIKEADKKGFKLDFEKTMSELLGVRYAKEIVQEVAKEYDWIPVTERLPEPFQRVLVYDALDNSMTIEHLQENDSFIDSVVAWMPLPIAPYQKGE